jgi:hypothetical protein
VEDKTEAKVEEEKKVEDTDSGNGRRMLEE